jgi:hypothetical protein
MKPGTRYVQDRNVEHMRALVYLTVRELHREEDERAAMDRRKAYEGAKV